MNNSKKKPKKNPDPLGKIIEKRKNENKALEKILKFLNDESGKKNTKCK